MDSVARTNSTLTFYNNPKDCMHHIVLGAVANKWDLRAREQCYAVHLPRASKKHHTLFEQWVFLPGMTTPVPRPVHELVPIGTDSDQIMRDLRQQYGHKNVDVVGKTTAFGSTSAVLRSGTDMKDTVDKVSEFLSDDALFVPYYETFLKTYNGAEVVARHCMSISEERFFIGSTQQRMAAMRKSCVDRIHEADTRKQVQQTHVQNIRSLLTPKAEEKKGQHERHMAFENFVATDPRDDRHLYQQFIENFEGAAYDLQKMLRDHIYQY